MPKVTYAIKVRRRGDPIWQNYLAYGSKNGMNRLRRNASQFEAKEAAEQTARDVEARNTKFECKVVKLW